MKAKKIIGIISNIVFLVLYIPLSVFFSFLGLMFLAYAEYTWAISHILLIGAGAFLLCTPIFCVIGLVLSIVFRKKEKYADSYVIQLVPFFTVLYAIFLMILSMLFGNG